MGFVYFWVNSSMAYPSEHYGLCSNGGLRIVLALVATFLVGYIAKPQLYSRESSSNQNLCPCDCDCSEEIALSLPLGQLFTSLKWICWLICILESVRYHWIRLLDLIDFQHKHSLCFSRECSLQFWSFFLLATTVVHHLI